MQTQKRSGTRHVQSTGRHPRSAASSQQERASLLLIAALCVLLPPLGLIILWRSSRIAQPMRLLMSLAATASMTLIFSLSMANGVPADYGIRPIPVVPTTAGYGASSDAALQTSAGYEDSSVAPAQPDGSVPAQPDGQAEAGIDLFADPISDEGGELDTETTVFAVTNNATSYHLYEICDTQTNNRVLTLQQALDEGLTPCEKCVGAAG